MALVISCVGAGGTGKTTAVKKLLEARDDVQMVPSVIRPTMVKLGFDTEKAMREAAPDVRLNVQLRLLDAYAENMERVIRNAEKPVLLFERTAIDHYGYILVHGGASINTATHKMAFELVQDLMQRFRRLFYFPYPTPFTNQVDDGFRVVEGAVGQNLMLDHIYSDWIGRFFKVMTIPMRQFDINVRAKIMSDRIDFSLGRLPADAIRK